MNNIFKKSIILVSVVGLLLVMTFFVVFSNNNGKFCIGKKCLDNKVSISDSYKLLTDAKPMIIKNYEEYQELATKDKAFADQVNLDEGDFRKNYALVFKIEHNGCGVFYLNNVRTLGKMAIAFFNLSNKNTCIDEKYYVFEKIDRNNKIEKVDSYYIEMKN